jgi:DNA-binding response OmpR family regulator
MDILVIEDDETVGKLLEVVLKQEGFAARFAKNGLTGLKAFEEACPDVILLDWMLPGLDGLEVCQRIRSLPDGNRPYIMMLTSRDDETDKVIGLSTGADDYLSKPFSPRELVARIRALVRRSQREEAKTATHILKSGHFSVDLDGRIAQKGEEALVLTALELDLLATFVTQPNRVWTRDQLINRLWGDDFFGDERVVDTHVARLRKKIEEDPARPEYLRTVIGVGYKFVDSVAGES